MTDTASSENTIHDHIRESIESIVIALILAFVFRAFIVEAFVIPTGSMAPTLYGAHGTILCEDCGTEFAYGLKDPEDPRHVYLVEADDYAYCPNCRHGNTNLAINDLKGNPEKGDRILVLKWPFDIGGEAMGPQRWDVIVFKDPADGVTNFIKRLVGLPNEVVMIVDGDVYAVPRADLTPASLAILDELRREKYERLLAQQARVTPMRGRRIRSMDRFPRTPESVLAEMDAKAHIVRKTQMAQKSLWLPVYDHDRPPRQWNGYEQPAWVPRLRDESGWQVEPRRLTYRLADGRAQQERDYIELIGPPVRATSAYNIGPNGNAPRPERNSRVFKTVEPPFVADLRVRFVLTPHGDAGGVAIRLNKAGRTFRAGVYLDGTVNIEEETPFRPARDQVHLTGEVDAFEPGRPVMIAFENLDYRLTLRVAGEIVLQTNDDPSSPGYYAPGLAGLRADPPDEPTTPRIYAFDGDITLTHVAVARDVYYYLDPRQAASWMPRGGWGGEETPIELRAGEYFMLGDNTAASKDSRLWDEVGDHLLARGERHQLGTVPEDQVIGKAFFVYWPAMQRVPWFENVPKLSRWGVVPDVGRMRWIR